MKYSFIVLNLLIINVSMAMETNRSCQTICSFLTNLFSASPKKKEAGRKSVTQILLEQLEAEENEGKFKSTIRLANDRKRRV